MQDLLEEFDIPGTAAFICSTLQHVAAPRVSLQFPDHQLRRAPAVVKALTAALTASPAPGPATRLFVLGDTTFGSCCVDEVAAAHISSHALVHYGHACMSAPPSLPVWYVLPRDPVDVPQVAKVVAHALGTAEGLSPKHRVLLLWDSGVAHAVPALLRAVAAARSGASEGAVAEVTDGWQVSFKHDISGLLVPSYARGVAASGGAPASSLSSCCGGAGAASSSCGNASSASCCGGSDSGCCKQQGSASCSRSTTCGCTSCEPSSPSPAAPLHTLRVGGLTLDLTSERGLVTPGPASAPSAWVLRVERLVVVHIGASIARRRLVAARFGSAAGLLMVYPTPSGAEGGGAGGSDDLSCMVPPRVVTRLQAQRYRVVEAIRGASVIGIVVGTLGVARHKEMVAALRQAAAWAGKAAYVMVVGKLTPTKLGNFPECEVFVNVSCPEAAVVDQVQGGSDAGGGGTSVNGGLLHVGLQAGLEPTAAATGPLGVGGLPGAGDFFAPIATPFEALVGLLGDPDYTPPSRPADESESDEAEEGDSDSLFARLFAWNGQLDPEFAPLLTRAAAAGMKLGAMEGAAGGSVEVREGEEGLTTDGQWTEVTLPARLREGGGATLSLVSGAAGLRGGGGVGGGEAAPAAQAATAAGADSDTPTAAASSSATSSSSSSALAVPASSALSTAFASAAGDFLATKRQWRGLAYEAPEAGSVEGATVIHTGQTGRAAAGYVAVAKPQ